MLRKFRPQKIFFKKTAFGEKMCYNTLFPQKRGPSPTHPTRPGFGRDGFFLESGGAGFIIAPMTSLRSVSPAFGGCLCGQARFALSRAPSDGVWCHCRMCQRAAGAPAVLWAEVHRADFRLTRGELRFFQSSERARRGFCPECGTSVVYHGTPDGVEDFGVAAATSGRSGHGPGFRPYLDRLHAARNDAGPGPSAAFRRNARLCRRPQKKTR